MPSVQWEGVMGRNDGWAVRVVLSFLMPVGSSKRMDQRVSILRILALSLSLALVIVMLLWMLRWTKTAFQNWR